MVVCLRREAVVAWGFVLPETVDGLPGFVDGEGALFQLPPLGVVEDLREAVDLGLGVRVQFVLGGRVLPEEAVLGGLEHCGWVVGEGAVLLPDRGDGAVAGVGHGVVEVADGLVGEFMLRKPLVFLGDALLPMDVPPLQVCPSCPLSSVPSAPRLFQSSPDVHVRAPCAFSLASPRMFQSRGPRCCVASSGPRMFQSDAPRLPSFSFLL